MPEIIGYCGLVCSECPAYVATVANDDAKRAAVAKQWSEEYGADVTAEDINCLGCHASDDSVFSHPLTCKIRLCGRERGIATCGHCDEYPCAILEAFFKMVPEARPRLDAISDSL
jgi:hypothetical protein